MKILDSVVIFMLQQYTAQFGIGSSEYEVMNTMNKECDVIEKRS